MRKVSRAEAVKSLLAFWGEMLGRRLDSSALGYPHKTQEQNLREHHGELIRSGFPPGSIVPNLDLPETARLVDEFVRKMGCDCGQRLVEVVELRYVVQCTKLSSQERDKLNQAVMYLVGAGLAVCNGKDGY